MLVAARLTSRLSSTGVGYLRVEEDPSGNVAEGLKMVWPLLLNDGQPFLLLKPPFKMYDG